MIYEDEIIYEDELPIEYYEPATNTSPLNSGPGAADVRQVGFESYPSIQDPVQSIHSYDQAGMNYSAAGSQPSNPESNAAVVSYNGEPVTNLPITEILIERSVTGGRDVDGRTGDEGLEMLIQPRTANGSVEFEAGELTVSLIDPSESPERQRIGLWKFLPGETELFFANDQIGNRGILLHLPWEQQTPANQKLIAHVRFITPDGRELKTSQDIQVTPPTENYSPDAPAVVDWTNHDSRWISAGNPQSNQPAQSTSVQSSPTKTRIPKPTWRPTR